ncbi:hypothetical protein [Nocardioides dilutus]
MNWTPGRMEEERALQAPRPGVPEDLRARLHDWCRTHFTKHTSHFFEFVVWRQEPWPDPRSNIRGAWSPFVAWADGDPTRYLDTIHHLLTVQTQRNLTGGLTEILNNSNSLYRVTVDGTGLEERAPAAVIEQVKDTVANADHAASKHLTNAWNAAYGYEKNNVFAWSESIRAVEVAMKKVIDPGATIFRAITNAAKDTSRWEFAVTDHRPAKYKKNAPAAEGVETVLDLMRLLAYGEHHRHGDDGTGTDPTDVEAKTAVQLAITLVQLVQSGAFKQK